MTRVISVLLVITTFAGCVSQPSGMQVQSRVTLPAEMIISGN